MVKIFTELTYFAARASAAQLRERAQLLEDVGAAGISLWDHLFGRSEDEQMCEPLTTLAAIAAISDTLELQTIVVNSAWIHPALLFRQFSQLAVLAGGQRVTAGLGAGWSSAEFTAIGLPFPTVPDLVSRFDETMNICHQLSHGDRVANLHGRHLVVKDLPNVPRPETAPQLLVGASGNRMLKIAARFADKLDFISVPGGVAGPPGATDMAAQHNALQRSRGQVTVDALAARVAYLGELTEQQGRPVDAVKPCVQVNFARLCTNAAEIERTDREICERWFDIPYRPLNNNPYVLRGEPAQIADTIGQRQADLNLHQITLQENQDTVAFLSAITPLLAT